MSSPGTIMRHLVLVAICLFTMVPGISALPPTDRDESRYVQASRQMLETGDYGDIRLQEAPRYKKPIGIYWLQAGAAHLTGYGEAAPVWVFRTVSIAGGIVAALATMWLATLMFGAGAGFLAGIAMASILGLGFEARIAKTDAALLAAAVLSQLFLARIYLGFAGGREIGGRPAIWFWLCLGVGVLIKGPIVPLVSGLTCLALLVFDPRRGWVRHLRIGWGVVIVAAINLPWLIYITLVSDGAFWEESVGRDLLGKVAEGQEAHGAPPGYYILTYALFVWPLSYIAIRGGLAAVNRFRTEAAARFLVAWYVPFWLFFEAVVTKLPHYVLPAYPALAIAAGWHLGGGADAPPLKRWQVWLTTFALAGLAIVTVGLATAAIGSGFYLTGEPDYVAIACGVLILVAGWLGSPYGDRFQPVRRVAAMAIAAGGAYALAATFVLPSVDRVWLSREVADVFHAEKPCAGSVLAITNFHEPSIVVLAGTATKLADASAAAAHLVTDSSCGVAAVEAADIAAFRAAAGDLAPRLAAVGRVRGINYSKAGRQLDMTLFVVR